MRKHHNKLYYGKYRYKTVLDLPESAMLWPTTDENLKNVKDNNTKMEKLWTMADFIINNRNKMKFRIQEKKSIFYSDKVLADEIKTKFIDHFVNLETVDTKHGELKQNVIGCDRLPHGKYRYQVHIKRGNKGTLLTDTQRNNLWNFIERNIDNCHVANTGLLDYLEGRSQYCFGGYMYVAEEKYLSPIYMMANNAIEKVIQFRKVENGSD
jgi:hypothetical protein